MALARQTDKRYERIDQAGSVSVTVLGELSGDILRRLRFYPVTEMTTGYAATMKDPSKQTPLIESSSKLWYWLGSQDSVFYVPTRIRSSVRPNDVRDASVFFGSKSAMRWGLSGLVRDMKSLGIHNEYVNDLQDAVNSLMESADRTRPSDI